MAISKDFFLSFYFSVVCTWGADYMQGQIVREKIWY